MTGHVRGIVLMVGAALTWSLGGLLVRLLQAAGPLQQVFWRSVFMTLFLVAVMIARYGRDTPARVRAIGWDGVIAGTLLAITFFCFLISASLTRVANTLVIMSTAPFVIALVSWAWIGERVAPRTWIAMAAGLAGIVLMVADSLARGGVWGEIIAFGVPTAIAFNIAILRRRAGSVDMVPQVFVAGLVSMAIALPFVGDFSLTLHDAWVLIIFGVVQLGLGCFLVTLASRHLRAAEIGLIGLLETTAGPLWVWLGVGERPTDLAMIGAAVVIVALALNEALALWQERRAR